jgi:hypothetical protein
MSDNVRKAAQALLAWHDDSFSRANVHGVYWQRELAARVDALRAALAAPVASTAPALHGSMERAITTAFNQIDREYTCGDGVVNNVRASLRTLADKVAAAPCSGCAALREELVQLSHAFGLSGRIAKDKIDALRAASTEGERERGFREGVEAAAVVAQEEAHCNERRALRAITAGTSWEWKTAASSCRSIEASIRALRAPPPDQGAAE